MLSLKRISLSLLALLLACSPAWAETFNPDAGCTLPTSLEAYWDMDEESGTRDDSKGASDLTDNNTVTFSAGKVSNAAQFTLANLESLTVADNAAISAGDTNWTWAGWVYLDAKTVSQTFASKWAIVAADREWLVQYDSVADRLVVIYRASATQLQINADVLGSPSTATWYFIVIYHDATNNVAGIQVNNGSENNSAWADGVQDGTGPFYYGVTFGVSVPFGGRIDECGFWRKVLTAQERTDLYNAGNANTYDPAGTCSQFKGEVILVN